MAPIVLDDVRLGVELDAEAPLVALADRRAQVRQAAARRVAVVASACARPRAASRPRSAARGCRGCRSRGRSRRARRAAARASAGRPSRRRRAADRGFAGIPFAKSIVGALPCRLTFCAAASARAEYPARRERDLRPLLRAARAGLRLGRARPRRRRASGSRPGRARCGATSALLPAPRRRTTQPAGPGWTPLVRAPRLASALGVGEVLPEARPLEPDALVQGPRRRASRRRRRASSASTRSRARRPATSANAVAARAAATRHARGRSSARARLEPEKLLATTVYGGDDLRRARQLRRLLAPRRASSPARSTGPSSTSTCAPTTRRARRRSRSRSPSSSAGRLPDAVVAPIASGAMFTKVWQGFEQFRRLGLVDGDAAAALRRPGRRAARPSRRAFAEERPRLAGAAATVAHVARDRQPGRRRPRDRDRARVGRRDLRRAGGGGRPEHRRCSPRRRRSSARARPASTVGALREAVGRGDARRARPRRRARHRHRPEDAAADRARPIVEIEADVDALLASSE